MTVSQAPGIETFRSPGSPREQRYTSVFRLALQSARVHPQALEMQVRLLSTLARDGSADFSVCLRYASQPDDDHALRQVDIHVLGSASAGKRDDARAAASQLSADIKRVLRLTLRDAYLFADVSPDLARPQATVPFQPQFVAELRRSMHPSLGPRHLRGHSTFARILEALLTSDQRVIFDVHAKPVTASTEELDFFERATLQLPDVSLAAENLAEHMGSQHPNPAAILSPAYTLARMMKPDVVTPPLMVVRLFVASEAVLRPLLLHTIGDELWADEAYEIDTYDIADDAAGDARDAILFGYLPEGEPYRGGDPTASRLRFLFDAYEASRAFRLPLAGIAGAVRTSFAVLEAPAAALPREGIVIGRGFHAAASGRIDVRLSEAERTKHTYIVGKTGTGKSTLLERMIAQDMQSGAGVCVLDPHGDLVDAVLARVPAERVDDTVLLDPAMVDHPFGLNLLELERQARAGDTHQKDLIVQEMVGILRRLFFHEFTGPVFEHNLRGLILTVLDDSMDGEGTLVEVPRLLHDRIFRTAVRAELQDELAKDFWEQYDQVGPESTAIREQLMYVVSKFDSFIFDRLMLRIIGQARSSVNLSDAITQRKILLVKLQSAVIGDLNAALLGMILISKLRLAAMARAELPPERRDPYLVYVDEFQNFASTGFETLLAEGRKYGLALTLAHQHIGQLVSFNAMTGGMEDRVTPAVFGNVGTTIAFRVGGRDAEILAREMGPPVEPSDLESLKNFHAIVATIIEGEVHRPFTIATDPSSPPGDAGIVELIRARARELYARPSAEVAQEIRARTEQIKARAAEDEDAPTPLDVLRRRRARDVDALLRELPAGPKPAAPKRSSAPRDASAASLRRAMELLSLSATEASRLFGVSRQAVTAWRKRGVPIARQPKLNALIDLVDLLERKLKSGRLPAVARRPADAFGGLTMLEMIEADRHDDLLDRVRESFDWSVTP